MNLRASLDLLTQDFVMKVLHAIREASLSELVTSRSPTTHREPTTTTTTRVRRSPAQLQKAADQLVAILKRHPKGMRAEDLKRAMGVKAGNRGAKVFTKPLSMALASKRVTKRGHRRATTYHAA